MIVLDTSAILALEDGRDRHHRAAVAALSAAPGPAVIPAGILAEVDHMLTSRIHAGATERVLDALVDGTASLDCGERDLARIRELMRRFADLPLGFSDAAVIASAERSGARVLTFDRRDFDVVARDVPIVIVP